MTEFNTQLIDTGDAALFINVECTLGDKTLYFAYIGAQGVDKGVPVGLTGIGEMSFLSMRTFAATAGQTLILEELYYEGKSLEPRIRNMFEIYPDMTCIGLVGDFVTNLDGKVTECIGLHGMIEAAATKLHQSKS